MSGNKTTHAVYAIHCKPTKRTYIGCSIDAYGRVIAHFKELRSKDGKQRRVPADGGGRESVATNWQHDFNEHGEKAFEMYILKDGMDKDEALDFEQEMIDKYRACEQEHGYNFKRKAERPTLPIAFKQGEPPQPA